MKNICAALLLTTAIYSVENKDQWVDEWIKGIEFAKDYKTLPKALEAYGSVIEELQQLKLKEIQLNIINERGELYFKACDFIGAVNDFSYIIEHPLRTKQQLYKALWGRSKALLAAGKFEEFEKDVISLDGEDNFFVIMNDTPNYSIVRLNLPAQEEGKNEKFINFLKIKQEIPLEKEVVFSPSGLVIIKK
jgi:hypothetical protein